MEPSELLSSFDQYDPAHVQVMHEVLAHARRECPVFHTTAEPGYWVVSRYADAKRILFDTAAFSNRNGVTVHGVGEPRPLPAAADPPLHKQYRDILRPYFTQQAIRAHEPELRKLAQQLMEPWLSTGEVEFVKDYAAKLAYAALFAVFLRSSGAEDIDLFVAGADRIVQESTQDAYAQLMGLVRQLLARRRSSGVEINDMIGAVELGSVDGRPLTEDEKVGMIFSAVAAGFETNYATMALIMHQVVRHPELETRIQGPDWASGHLAEFLRFVSPVTGLIRTVTRDTEIGGVALRAGDTVLVHYASVDRDEAQFPQADTLDFARPNSGQHMAFSFGVHRCLGAPFAEFLIGIGLEELTRRATGFRLRDPELDVPYTTGVVCRPEALPLTFELR
ncbi:cytochrome P450 [Pseudonocardia eucalypti]|uniref:Cytochrome P450 n=1 Tax=Pseudonocardia eucalypti TaxID=648755 RepID=A0ABP9PTK4_9PSEU|nr:cytochrome P450 [Pseudonocardia eucalypti]